jgi:hypothetical protein
LRAGITGTITTGENDVSHQSKILGWLEPQSEAEIRTLLERARSGDATDLEALREALDRYPEIWQAYGNLAKHARDALIEQIAGVDLALVESLSRQVEAMKAELAGPAPSPLETLLIDRIVACWIQIGHADLAAAQAKDVSIQQANYNRKRQDSAHRRYLTAAGALAMTRRLLGPAGGSSGLASKARSPSTGPGKIDGDNCSIHRDGEQGAVRAADDPSEDDNLLEIGPTSEGASGKNSPRRRRGSKKSSKP